MEQKINYLEEKMAIMQHELAQMSQEGLCTAEGGCAINARNRKVEIAA